MTQRRTDAAALDSSEFRLEHNRLSTRLQKANRYLINPRSQKMQACRAPDLYLSNCASLYLSPACADTSMPCYAQYWDMTTLTALIFTATVTPYEVCLIWAETEVNALFVINNLVNLIFAIDMVFIFFLPYSVKDEQPVKDHRQIARHYLRTWFFLDLVSIAPLDWLMVTDVLDTEAVNPSMLQMVRLIRLFRLIKLARILRASRIFSRWENSISMPNASRTLIGWVIAITITLHWFACGLGLLAQMQGSLRDDVLSDLEALIGARMQHDPFCKGCNRTDPVLNEKYCGDMTPCLTPCEIEEVRAERLPPGRA